MFDSEASFLRVHNRVSPLPFLVPYGNIWKSTGCIYLVSLSSLRCSLNFLKNIFEICALFSEGDIPEAILKSFLAVDAELKTYGNSTELTGSTGTVYLGTRTSNEATFLWSLKFLSYILLVLRADLQFLKFYEKKIYTNTRVTELKLVRLLSDRRHG